MFKTSKKRQLKKHERLAEKYSKKSSKAKNGIDATEFYTRYRYHARKAIVLKEELFN